MSFCLTHPKLPHLKNDTKRLHEFYSILRCQTSVKRPNFRITLIIIRFQQVLIQYMCLRKNLPEQFVASTNLTPSLKEFVLTLASATTAFKVDCFGTTLDETLLLQPEIAASPHPKSTTSQLFHTATTPTNRFSQAKLLLITCPCGRLSRYPASP